MSGATNIRRFFDFQPTTMEEAVDHLHSQLQPSEIAFGVNHGFECLHFTTGMAMRNAWLWDDPYADDPTERRTRVLAGHFRKRFGLGHADDMSGMIMKSLTCKVRNLPYDPDEDAANHYAFWLEQDIDPLTQKASVKGFLD